MKLILFILSFLLLSSPLFGQSEETCYVASDSKDFDRTLLSNISVSLISQFLKEVEHLPPAGIPMDACVYQIVAKKVEDTTFVTFTGKNLNSIGISKLSGPDGFQESVLKALYRALKDKRKLICDAYGEFIVECGGVVKKIPAEKIETIREMKNKYDQLEKRIAVLDTRIERLNSGVVKVVTNPDSFENPKLDGVKKVFTDEPVVQKIAKRKSDCLKNGMIRQLLDTKKCPNCDLCGADLNGEDLRGANLRGANLSGANLTKANLSDANLTKANLSDANLSDANLGHARLNGANLTGVIGKFAYMVDANLIEANLNEAELNGANLSGANLTDANLSDANLSDANLSLAKLRGTNLSHANLNDANLKGANLVDANLSNANLNKAVFGGTKMNQSKYLKMQGVIEY